MNTNDILEFIKNKQSIRNIFSFGDNIKLLPENEILDIMICLNSILITRNLNSTVSTNGCLLYNYIEVCIKLYKSFCFINYNNIINEILDFDFTIEHKESEINNINCKLLQLNDDTLKNNILFLLEYMEDDINDLSSTEIINISNNIKKILTEPRLKKIISVIYKELKN